MELDKELEQAEAERARWVALLATDGWGLLAEQMRAVRINKRNEVLSTTNEGLNGLIEDAKSKSELAGIEFALNWPALQIETLDMQIMEIRSAMQAELENEHDAPL